jgi:hypothetical protein
MVGSFATKLGAGEGQGGVIEALRDRLWRRLVARARPDTFLNAAELLRDGCKTSDHASARERMEIQKQSTDVALHRATYTARISALIKLEILQSIIKPRQFTVAAVKHFSGTFVCSFFIIYEFAIK